MHKSQKGLARFLIPRRNASKLFEVVAKPFHLLASLVEGLLVGAMGYPVTLRGYDRHHVMRHEVLAEVVAVIPFVYNGMRQ
jgi:hypothetical protein